MDPSLVPPEHHAAYTCVRAPTLSGDIDWSAESEKFVERALADIEARGAIPKLR